MKLCSALLLLIVTAVSQASDSDKPVTYGSAVKLTHMESGGKYYLSSENKNLGTGSGQQIVTWMPSKSSTTTLWLVRGSNEEGEGVAATPIACGSKIRLTHLETRRNLHTHGIPSPLSRQQEISGFGDDGKGDTGDDWIIECKGKYWMRDTPVKLRHVDTDRYLSGSDNVKFTQQNCGHGCPILNHLEAFGRKQNDNYSDVKVEMGVLLHK